MQGDGQHVEVLVTLDIPPGWMCAADISLIPPLPHAWYILTTGVNIHIIIHARLLIKISGHSRLSLTALPTYMGCMWLTSVAGWSYTIYLFLTVIGDTAVIKRGPLIDFQNHTLFCKYISKGKACMASMICSAWFKHAKAVFRPPANTFELPITRCCQAPSLHTGADDVKMVKIGIERLGESTRRNCATVIWWIIKVPFADFLIGKGNPVINISTRWLVWYITETYNSTSTITVSSPLVRTH